MCLMAIYEYFLQGEAMATNGEKEEKELEPFKFSRSATAIAAIYAIFLTACVFWLMYEGVIKGALLGKLVGFLSIVSVFLVLFIAHPKKERAKLMKISRDQTKL
jgi:sterol desaturase/sphingolipid hydroxylase (fatty acid hydroxylase superfamily)